jgi:hypothetical protein
MSSWGQRKDDRVNFDRGISVHIIAIDGTWRRGCKLLDISQSGARLLMDDTIGGLNLKEFFLCLSQSGSVFRRCELIRVNGDEVGVHFLEKGPKKKMANGGKRQPGVANRSDE